mmetsp:Transcript_44830/g.138659  ORF Transcript_44830/g.138659 Transcript_44830/m.138659 type:complete len:273 (+) Transcript_44830:98-916(+)
MGILAMVIAAPTNGLVQSATPDMRMPALVAGRHPDVRLGLQAATAPPAACGTSTAAACAVGLGATALAMRRRSRAGRDASRLAHAAEPSQGMPSGGVPHGQAAPPPALFDPLGLCMDAARYSRARSIEMSIGRLAMLGAAGYPAAELYHDQIADTFGLPNLLTPSGQAPMWLNGGSFGPMAEAAVVLLSLIGLGAAALEAQSNGSTDSDPMNLKGLRLQPKLSPLLKSLLNEAQMVNGRVAMFAFVAMMMQEAMTGEAAVNVPPLGLVVDAQ